MLEDFITKTDISISSNSFLLLKTHGISVCVPLCSYLPHSHPLPHQLNEFWLPTSAVASLCIACLSSGQYRGTRLSYIYRFYVFTHVAGLSFFLTFQVKLTQRLYKTLKAKVS